MRFRTLSPLLLAALFASCAGTPGPGDSGYPFNVSGTYSSSIDVQGISFAGTIQLLTESGGVVSGTFEVTQPVPINGTVEGSLLGDQLTLEVTYGNNPATGCSGGTVTGTVTVTEGGDEAGGPVEVNDCGAVIASEITLTR